LGTGVKSTLQIDSTKSKTIVDEEGNVKTTLPIDSESSIETNLNIDGTVSHSVTYRGVTTNVVSNIKGAKIVIDAKGEIETTSEVEKNGFKYKAIISTDIEGKTQTKIVKIDVATGKELVIASTLKNRGSYELGSNAIVVELNSLIYIKVNTPLNNTLVIE
jgi:predicted transcriptional regulator